MKNLKMFIEAFDLSMFNFQLKSFMFKVANS
jgi:hypothetical protein